MKIFLFYFAITGWVLACLAHLLTLAGFNVFAEVPFIWILHIGIFVVFVPAIFFLNKNEEFQAYQQAKKERRKAASGLVSIVFKGVPQWLKIMVFGSFFYAILNFFLFASSQDGTPALQDGQYILHNHGKFIKNITEQEYNDYKANELRGFSGHWLLFYGLAAAILFPFKKQENNE